MANTTLTDIGQSLSNRFVDDRKRVWGDSFNWSFNRTLSQVKYLVIHHSVTSPYIFNPTGTVKREKTWQEQVDEIASIHKAKGWGGIGYHFVITSHGIVAYVGDIGTGRANVANHNEKVIGINLVGDFTKHLPTDIQINSAHDLCTYFLFNFPLLTNINRWEDVIGHKDCAQVLGNTTVTACPGSSWPVDMKSRIKDNVIYFGPAPTSPNTPSSTPETEPVVFPESLTDISSDPIIESSVIDPETSPTDVPVGDSVDSSSPSPSGGVSSPTEDKKVVERPDPIASFFRNIINWFKKLWGR